ncbi:GNAT family N-acetyltransferase [Myxococcota bacterium]|nr:GNAT family N-acetyltransferase [Myxococcota bacterium]MBU1382830.1 GNAT family N-acetyltransferase [Myxococcota bacterium]MBU1498979.1 GNAT family N-acetyltransferase [Myxococcota bacterium]
MIFLSEVKTRSDWNDFYSVTKDIYVDNPHSRSTEDSIVKMLASGNSVFFKHAQVYNYLIKDGSWLAGRFSLIYDRNLPEYVQVAFFEAKWGLDDVLSPIKLKAQKVFPGIPKMVIGLCGHLNYAAGILTDSFHEAPLFGLPYNPPWYQEYFKNAHKKSMVSYRFENTNFYNLLDSGRLPENIDGFRIRHMDKSRLEHDVKLYTYLNNINFKNHPYWSDRLWEEDYELFHPFRFFMKEENLIFAEYKGDTVGFLLWYPDFNELAPAGQDLGLRHLLKFRFQFTPKTARFTEIAVKEEFRRSGVVELMVADLTKSLKKGGYTHTEGGFIFEENSASIGMTMRLFERGFGRKLDPYRHFAVFEVEL